MGNWVLRQCCFIAIVNVVLFVGAASGRSDDWSRLAALERYTMIKITLEDGNSMTGSFMSASTESISLRIGDRDEIAARNQIRQVAVEKHGRRWYSIPLAGFVGGGGAAIGYAVTRNASCSNGTEACSRARGILAFALPAAAAVLTYRATLGTSWKVIYKK